MLLEGNSMKDWTYPKSQDDLMVTLYREMLQDLSNFFPQERRSFLRDFETLQSRVSKEGVSFLTKTLPKLAKALEGWCETGELSIPREFPRNGKGPEFLQGVFGSLNRDPGDLEYSKTDIGNAVAHIRQICYTLYKYEAPYSKEEEAKVVSNFVETDGSLALGEAFFQTRMAHLARAICEEVCEGIDPLTIIPSHGPGAVATGEKGDEKWTFGRLFSSIHQCYPYYDYFVVGGASELADRLRWYRSLSRLESGVAKVCLVPKDSRGPRLISCEPLEYQWIQQGLGRKVVSHLEQHPLTRCMINFRSQEINRNLAFQSSIDGQFATLDLQDASDRVSLELVEFLYPPVLMKYLRCCRTPATQLPDGTVVPLRKFAPMGSALCFPIEALTFWCLSVAAIATSHAVDYRKAARFVYVYGDDIIVPTEYFQTVVDALSLANLKVNVNKSFHRGKFRESCGMDAYDGIDVTPTRIKTPWSGKSSDGSAFVSWSSYGNAFARRGYIRTSQYIWFLIESVYGKIPYGTSTSGFPCRWCSDPITALRYNQKSGFPVRITKDTLTIQVKCKYVRDYPGDTTLDGWNRLLRNCVTGKIDRPTEVARLRSARIKYGWRTIQSTFPNLFAKGLGS